MRQMFGPGDLIVQYRGNFAKSEGTLSCIYTGNGYIGSHYVMLVSGFPVGAAVIVIFNVKKVLNSYPQTHSSCNFLMIE